MAAPVLQAHTARRGALTRVGAGKVPVGQFMAPGVDTTGWTWAWTLTSGTAGHWTTTTDGMCPSPLAAGVTAGLNGGPYVWSVTATNASAETSAPADWTHTIAANTYTVASPADVDTGANSLRVVKGLLGGKTIEIARGSFAAFDGSGGDTYPVSDKTLIVKSFGTHLAGTRITWTSEDLSNRSKIGRIDVQGGSRMDFLGFDVEAYVAARTAEGALPQDVVMFTIRHTPSQGMPDDITVSDMTIGAPEGTDSTQWLKSMLVNGQNLAPNAQVTNIRVFDVDLIRANDGLTSNHAASCTYSDIRLDSCGGDGFFRLGTHTNCIWEDLVTVRPVNNPTRRKDPTPSNPDAEPTEDHQDTFQAGHSESVADNNGNIVRRCVFAVADGDSMPQGPWYRNFNFAQNNETIENVLSDPATYNNIRPDRGTGWNIVRNTAIQGQSIGIPADDKGRGAQRFSINRTGLAVGICRDNIFNHYDTTPSNGALVSFPDLLTDNLILSVAQTSPPMPTGINWAEADRIAYSAPTFDDPGMVIDYANLTAAQIRDQMKLAYAAKLDGLAKKPDGTYHGALFPDGTWNDGTVFDSTPPTAISSSAPAATVEVGAPLVITYQLDAQAFQAVSIDPAVAGVTGSFDPDPASVAIGLGQVTSTFIATSPGTATITATNNRSLANPTPLVITVTAVVAPPTTYTQQAASVSSLGQAVQIGYVLNEPAPGPITITAASTLAGSFPSGETVVIPASGTSGVITFVPSVAGTATLTATNDSGLANPDSIQVVVSAVNVAQLIVLGLR